MSSQATLTLLHVVTPRRTPLLVGCLQSWVAPTSTVLLTSRLRHSPLPRLLSRDCDAVRPPLVASTLAGLLLLEYRASHPMRATLALDDAVTHGSTGSTVTQGVPTTLRMYQRHQPRKMRWEMHPCTASDSLTIVVAATVCATCIAQWTKHLPTS